MYLVRNAGIAVALLFAVSLAIWGVGESMHEIRGGNAPPPYDSGDVNKAIVNALGNVGRTEGFGHDTSILTDVMRNDATSAMRTYGGAELADEMGRISVYPFLREVVITLVTDPAASNGAVCARLGPASEGGGGVTTDNPDGAPALTCPDTNASPAYTGGCYLFAQGQSCTFMIRPKTSGCVDYASCHIPIWIVESAALSTHQVNVAMVW